MSWEACGKVLKIDGLGSTDKFVLLVLAQYSSAETQMCWASINTICEDCGCSDNTVRRAIKELRRKKLIKDVIERAGQTTVYVLDYDQMDAMARPKKEKKPLTAGKGFKSVTPAKTEGVDQGLSSDSPQVQFEPETALAAPVAAKDEPLTDCHPLQVGSPPLPTCNPTPSEFEGVPLTSCNPILELNQDRNQEGNQENKQSSEIAVTVLQILRQVPGIARAANETPDRIAELMAENPGVPPASWVGIARGCRDWCEGWKSMGKNSVHARSGVSVLRDYLSRYPERSGAAKPGLKELPEGREAV